MVFQKPLEIQIHTIPHKKGLINVRSTYGRQERGSNFTQQKIHLKTPCFISYPKGPRVPKHISDSLFYVY